MERNQEHELQHKVEEKSMNKLGDGVACCRVAMIGKGSCGSVYLATSKKPRSRFCYFPSIMAMKSAEVSVSGTIQREREVFTNVKRCSDILRFYGEETTKSENGVMVYNLLLGYGSGGSLVDMFQKLSGDGLPESDVRRYTRCILRGMNHIHECGYVHCDIKPENILLVPLTRGGSSEMKAKIGDFGLAKRANQSKKRKLEPYWRGTPLYLSPEALAYNVKEPPSDIWALGCTVLEMLTGNPPWYGKKEMKVEDILEKIRDGHQLPEIPSEISEEARNFLKVCFVRKEMYGFTAEMLLNHPFVEGLVEDDGIEESDEVSDVSQFSSFLLLSEVDGDDEVSSCSFSNDCNFLSAEEYYSYCSEDAEGMDNQEFSSFAEETLHAEESRGIWITRSVNLAGI